MLSQVMLSEVMLGYKSCYVIWRHIKLSQVKLCDVILSHDVWRYVNLGNVKLCYVTVYNVYRMLCCYVILNYVMASFAIV